MLERSFLAVKLWGDTMTRFVALVASVSVLVLAAAGTAGAAIRPTYVSLGDSLAQGYQPIGGPRTHAVLPIYGYGQGYADQLFKLERGRYTQLQLVKLGCGGESTVSMLDGSQDPNVAASCDLRPSTPLDIRAAEHSSPKRRRSWRRTGAPSLSSR